MLATVVLASTSHNIESVRCFEAASATHVGYQNWTPSGRFNPDIESSIPKNSLKLQEVASIGFSDSVQSGAMHFSVPRNCPPRNSTGANSLVVATLC